VAGGVCSIQITGPQLAGQVCGLQLSHLHTDLCSDRECLFCSWVVCLKASLYCWFSLHYDSCI